MRIPPGEPTVELMPSKRYIAFDTRTPLCSPLCATLFRALFCFVKCTLTYLIANSFVFSAVGGLAGGGRRETGAPQTCNIKKQIVLLFVLALRFGLPLDSVPLFVQEIHPTLILTEVNMLYFFFLSFW